MGKWLDLARRMQADAPCANSVISADSPGETAKMGDFGTIGTIGTAPPTVADVLDDRCVNLSHLSVVRRDSDAETRPSLASNEWDLPHETYWRLRRLSLTRPATITMPQPLWAALVCDTVLFAKRGWAAKAMALGWSEMDIFGVASHGWQGVTSRLIGREVLGLDARKVAVQDGRHVAQLPRETLAADAVLIWEVGKR